ncbi:hypothetical protein MTR67_003772 [Solanum verrucosum]|uniref:Uncharacterized protein n=1 Tax=Solanum verrucosum TaxID=315347 RepID=A0AAF0T765_SOLVR|nr:hypothetical protein MTR67_003772 [Solanum verrucosum]
MKQQILFLNYWRCKKA